MWSVDVESEPDALPVDEFPEAGRGSALRSSSRISLQASQFCFLVERCARLGLTAALAHSSPYIVNSCIQFTSKDH